MKRGKKNTAAALAQVIVRQEHYVLECMSKPQMCLGAQLLIFSPEIEDSLFSEEFSGRLLTRENRIRKHRF